MNLIKLLFKLRKTLKGLGDERNVVIELSKKGNGYFIKKMYTHDKLKDRKVEEDRPEAATVISEGRLFLDNIPVETLAEAVEPEITRIQKKNEKIERRFR